MDEEHLPGKTLQAGAAAQEGSETDALSRQSKPGGVSKPAQNQTTVKWGELAGLVPMGTGHTLDLCCPCPVQWSHLLFPPRSILAHPTCR